MSIKQQNSEYLLSKKDLFQTKDLMRSVKEEILKSSRVQYINGCVHVSFMLF